ncbi:hypothetical protein JM946_12610 [Steroidobacter sp. S1-65]|uniref:Uncharacterized protein n=1 Tax=Steroidobacter gossypii TaxID=2805490 RepID=A0ABS1WX92_9GAMM|nr:hypothetical protein [Steroidobacter gossypii]MBM0105600.1 hypothetical protein [Steroidobacter gossypii]
MIGVGVLVGGVLLYYFGNRTVKAATDAIGGAVTGNNALTEGTAYEGVGFGIGTLGAIFNRASGGVLGELGSWIGGTAADAKEWAQGQIYDVFNKATLDPNQRAFDARGGLVRPEDRPSSLR